MAKSLPSSRSITALSLIVLLTSSYLFADYRSSTPDSYALCSRDSDKVYTVDGENSQTQCIVVRGAFIVDRGSLHSHAHILEYGAAQQLPLEGTKTIQDTVARVREFILANPEVLNDTSKLIQGGGWDHTVWPTRDWPTSAHLENDPVIRGRPVILQSKDCHALWASSKAIEASMPFPESVDGGVIVRDKTGNPTDKAQELLKQPELTEGDLLRRFHVAVRDAHAYGLTAIHDAGLDPASLAFFKRQAAAGTLPLRIYGMTFFNENEEYWGNKTTPLIGAGNDRLTARSVKIFADGKRLENGRCSCNHLYEPYTDNPSTNGFMRLDSDVLFDVIPKFLRDGWQVNVHAIGDRANGIVLDAFEASLNGVNVTASRPRLEHAQMMAKADMKRLGRLGVIASVQPTHAISDMWYAEDRLGPERIKGLYAFRSLIDSGARITLGSDFPVEPMNPLAGFFAAVTRVSVDGTSPHDSDGWFPEQRLTRQEALRGMTIDPAYASFTESTLGSLELGKRADYVVLSQDIMTIPTNEILATKVLATALDGQTIYGGI
ncbi:hypothetical protein H0H81_008307 [Sphagnurus paluster]|uniref:Amidohydrolase 3 domain-containing protein n=1 Tax=Sphagnurus paluster TaxID=117069 RepID=A0A9P7K4Q4_9AGAR|nr:hypothetical protein H0H81_008307 [Sphagnurus paluster]